jgi:hypothetical protein
MLTDICTEVHQLLKQAPHRSTKAVDSNHDAEGGRGSLAGAAAARGAEAGTFAGAGQREFAVEYMESCNGGQGMGFCVRLGGGVLLRTSALH